MKTVREILVPIEQQDEFTKWMLDPEGGGFLGAKLLPDGTYAGVLRLAFTYAIALGVDQHTIATRRFCFEGLNINGCLHEYEKLQSINDDPVGWVASRPKAEEWEFQPITTAPLDGTIIKVANFSFGHCNWLRLAVFQSEWIGADTSCDGIVLEPTHWRPAK